MPAHLRRRNDRGGVFVIVDGRHVVKSTGTTVKRYADLKLKEYLDGKFGVKKEITVGEYYERWIETKKPPMDRPAKIEDYRQVFRAYILPKLATTPLRSVTLAVLRSLRDDLLRVGAGKPGTRPLKLKTVKDAIINGPFRAMWRDALRDRAFIPEEDPFRLIQWPKMPKLRPEAFTAEERDRIIAWWKARDPFYCPYVLFQFYTGMRPSETAALTWDDVDLERRTISITKSSNKGVVNGPKTNNSERTIVVPQSLIDILTQSIPYRMQCKHVFVNKDGNPMRKNWVQRGRKTYWWGRCLKDLGIKHLKFYATRHTFITEAIQRGENPLAVAQYCGTSLDMIQKDYCGTLTIGLTEVRPFDEITQQNQDADPVYQPRRLLSYNAANSPEYKFRKRRA